MNVKFIHFKQLYYFYIFLFHVKYVKEIEACHFFFNFLEMHSIMKRNTTFKMQYNNLCDTLSYM